MTQPFDWIEARLAEAGLWVTDRPGSPRSRPWGQVLRVPTSAGVFWFKANGPGCAYEAALLDALGRWRLPGIVAPLAVDVDRAWSLTADAGVELRSRPPCLDAWLRFLQEYAQLQLACVPHTEELLKLGVPDFRTGTLPGRLRQLLVAPAWLDVGGRYGVPSEDHRRLFSLEAAYERWCAELSGIGVPETLQHDDLHDGNVFVTAGGRFAFLDWGDAFVGHPFGSLAMAQRVGRMRFGAAALPRLRDAYLEPWTDRYDQRTLLAAADLALRVVHIGRMFTWQRALLGLTPAQYGRWSDGIREWFQTLLNQTEPLTDHPTH